MKDDKPLTAAQLLRKHRPGHAPDCTRQDPHFIPPSFGQVGFQACNPPDDLTNTRLHEIVENYTHPRIEGIPPSLPPGDYVVQLDNDGVFRFVGTAEPHL